MEHNFKIFISVLKKMMDGTNIHGIVLHLTNHTKKLNISSQELQVPTFKISNPKNIPFSYNCFYEFVINEFEIVNSFAGTDFPRNILSKLVIFDDFGPHDFYIPVKDIDEIERYLNNKEVQIKCFASGIDYNIRGKYIIDSTFYMHFSDYESFDVDISFQVLEVMESSEPVPLDDEIMDFVRDLSYDETYLFESPIWDCFDDLVQPPFIDKEWQYLKLNLSVFN